jgi:hypothetical protein
VVACVVHIPSSCRGVRWHPAPSKTNDAWLQLFPLVPVNGGSTLIWPTKTDLRIVQLNDRPVPSSDRIIALEMPQDTIAISFIVRASWGVSDLRQQEREL